MSIAATVLQFLTVSALRENGTLAGENVIGTPIDPISAEFARITKPTLAVFTGEDRRGEVKGRDLSHADREVELSLQIYCPAQVAIVVDGTALRIETRGEGGDLVADILGRQVERALLASDTPAAVLWRKLVVKVPSVISAPFLFETEGTRIFVVETTYVCQLLHEPPFGDAELTGFWAEAVAAFLADPDYAPLGRWIETEIMSPAFMSAGRVLQAEIGTTDEAARGAGMRELEDDGDLVSEITADRQPGPDVVINETTAEDADPEGGP